MARVKIEDGKLVINMKGMRRFLTFKNEICVPLANVESVTTGLEWKDVPNIVDKVVGTNAVDVYYGGTFKEGGFGTPTVTRHSST
jgi:hypothetical protein